MNIITIASNIKGNVDGIGKHARILTEEYCKRGENAIIISGDTWQKSKIKKVMSLQMTKCIYKACKEIVKERIDLIVYEYPFAEFNPLIIIPVVSLFFLSRFNHTKVAISMHEYDRVSIFRKFIICVLFVFTDIVYVSEKKYLKRFPFIRHKIHLRTIPNHIVKPKGNKIIHKQRYSYFGLINRAKAFQEMIDAWNKFNKDNQYQLDIMTCSDYDTWDKQSNHNVHFHFNLSGDEVSKILFESTFILIPVLPNIGLNNSSFMSGIQCGCIPIGIFNNELKRESFVLHQNSYNMEDFNCVLQKSQTLADDTIYLYANAAIMFGQRFSVKNTVDMMLNFLQLERHTVSHI